MTPPSLIDGAQVIRWSVIDWRHYPTGNCRQIAGGEVVCSVAGLAICRYETEEGYYLFGCDPNWKTVTDTTHRTLEEAFQQAEFEYEGVTATWNVV